MKRRERKEIEVTRRRRGGVKGRETDLTSISSLSVLHSPEHINRFTDLGREEKGEGGHRPPGGEKGESKGGENNQASDLAPK